MKFVLATCVLFVHLAAGNCVFAQESENNFKKNNFYIAMGGKNEEAINKQLDILQMGTIANKDAYEGALLMKKASLAGGPKKKLDLFKKGHKKLEGVLQKDSLNAEFRFLRLMIQEHAPGILNYNKEMEKDKLYIKNNFKKLPPDVQDAVRDYSKDSKILKPADL